MKKVEKCQFDFLILAHDAPIRWAELEKGLTFRISNDANGDEVAPEPEETSK